MTHSRHLLRLLRVRLLILGLVVTATATAYGADAPSWRQAPQPWRNPNASAPSGGAPKGETRPLQWWTINASAPSHVLKRGDLEILTYETEEDYDRLQELYRKSQDSQPTPGEMTTRYYRSDIDGSVQPYAVWLPRDYDPGRKYSLVVQLHGTNFKEVLSGSRLTYRGMGGRSGSNRTFR